MTAVRAASRSQCRAHARTRSPRGVRVNDRGARTSARLRKVETGSDADHGEPIGGDVASLSDWDGVRYDAPASPQARWGHCLLDRLELDGDETVLAAGCGSCRVTDALLRRPPGGRVVALGASTSMLDQARHRLSDARERVRSVRADLLELVPDMPAADVPVDALFSTVTSIGSRSTTRCWPISPVPPRGSWPHGARRVAPSNTFLRSVRSLVVQWVSSGFCVSAKETAACLDQSGFADVGAWTHEEPTPFSARPQLVDFLEVICRREQLASVPARARRTTVERVALALCEPVLNHLRLNVVARRA